MKTRLITCFALGVCAFALTAAPASASFVYGFQNISNNLAGDAAIGEAQLFVEVLDVGSNQVRFNFYNTGPAASSITDTYFDDGTLLGIAGLIDADDGVGGDPGVDYSEGASPGNLPSANSVSPAFEATAGFLADSDPPTQHNGVNPGESLGIVFDLQATRSFNDVIQDLATGALRIGIHVQGFASGGSESYVNAGPQVPTPAAVLLGGIGIALLGWVRRYAR